MILNYQSFERGVTFSFLKHFILITERNSILIQNEQESLYRVG